MDITRLLTLHRYFKHCHAMAPVLSWSLKDVGALEAGNASLFLAVCTVGCRFWDQAYVCLYAERS